MRVKASVRQLLEKAYVASKREQKRRQQRLEDMIFAILDSEEPKRTVLLDKYFAEKISLTEISVSEKHRVHENLLKQYQISKMHGDIAHREIKCDYQAKGEKARIHLMALISSPGIFKVHDQSYNKIRIRVYLVCPQCERMGVPAYIGYEFEVGFDNLWGGFETLRCERGHTFGLTRTLRLLW